MQDENFWRNTINNLKVPLPDVGIDPPPQEIIETTEQKVGGIDPETSGQFSKITLDVYFFMSPVDNKYFMMQTQGMTDYGEITLKKATEMVKRKQRRNRGTA